MNYREFLSSHNLGAEYVDSNEILELFFSEMKKGLKGDESSLRMIATYQESPDTIKKGEPVIVMDAGGTNFRTVLVTFNDDNKPVLEDFKRVPMPGVDREVTAKEFYSIFADNIERFMGKSNRIGFCFSYAAEITEDHDGIPLMFSKEIKAPETIGRPLGKEILEELRRRGYEVDNVKISIVNDTVATLLAAKAESEKKDASFVGFILGTGTNTAYVEKNSNIGKIKRDDGSQIINTESGCLKIELTDLDRAFMLTTQDPNSYHLEKMISGAYLGSFSYFVIKKAIEEGVFSPLFVSSFSSLSSLKTEDVGSFISSGEGVLGKLEKSKEDSISLYLILETIIERAGKLTALNLSAAALFSSGGESVDNPIVINADGTTFYKLPYLKFYTTYYLEEILKKKNRRFYKIVNIDSSPIIGAAISALAL